MIIQLTTLICDSSTKYLGDFSKQLLCEHSAKGPSIYDVRKIFVFFDPLPPCHYHTHATYQYYMYRLLLGYITPLLPSVRTSYVHRPKQDMFHNETHDDRRVSFVSRSPVLESSLSEVVYSPKLSMRPLPERDIKDDLNRFIESCEKATKFFQQANILNVEDQYSILLAHQLFLAPILHPQ